MDPMEWRKKHPRCRYCKYLTIKRVGWENTALYVCKAKDKVKDVDVLFVGKGMFCRVFEPEVIQLKYTLYKDVIPEYSAKEQILYNRGIPKEKQEKWLNAYWDSIWDWTDLGIDLMENACA